MRKDEEFEFIALNRKEFGAVKKEGDWTQDEQLSKLFGYGVVYRHDDGRILSEFALAKKGSLFPSEEAFLKYTRYLQNMAAQPPRHLLLGRQPYDDKFPEHIDELVQQLSELLEIPSTQLDKSLESLAIVTTKLRKKYRRFSDRAMIPDSPLFLPLIAYAGEVMRVWVNGHWLMFQNTQFAPVWEMWIVDPEGRFCSPFMAVWENTDLDEPYPIDLLGAVKIRAAGRRVLRGENAPKAPPA